MSDTSFRPEDAPAWVTQDAERTYEPEPPAEQPAGPPPSPERPAGYGTAFQAGFASHEDERVRLFAKELYPNEPPEQAAKRFSYVGGRLAHTDDEGEAYWVLPGTARKVLQALPKQSALVAGGIAGILSAPTGAMSIPIAGGAAAAAETGRQVIGDAMFPPDVQDPRGIDPWSVVRQGVQEGAGQGVGLGIGQMMKPRTAPDIGQLNRKTTEQAYRRAEHPLRGAPGEVPTKITPGQATDLRSVGMQEKRLAQKVATANQMEALAREQDAAALQNWNAFLENISREGGADEAGDLARGAAQKAIEQAKAVRRNAAQPYYDKALKEENPEVDISDTLSVLDAWIAKGSDTGLGKAAQQLKKALTKRVQVPDPQTGEMTWVRVPKTSLEELDVFKKFELDRMISTRMAKDTPLDNTMVRELQILKQGSETEGVKGFMPTLKEASPTYKMAVETFEEGSPEVDRVLGTALKNVAELKDPQLMKTATKLLSPTGVTPRGVLAARREIERVNPAAWRAVKRVYLQQTARSALKGTQQGETVQPAGKLWKAFMGDASVMQNMRAAMEPREWAMFRQLMGHYRDLARRAVEKSDTAWNLDAMEAERKGAVGILGKVIGNVNPAAALRNAREWLTDRRIEKQALKMLDIVTSGDKDSLRQIQALKQFGKGDWRRYALLGHLITKGTEMGGQAAWDYMEGE